MSSNILQLHKNDNVGVVLKKIDKGSENEQLKVFFNELIPSGHKVSLKKIKKDEPIFKYNQIIGFASKEIKKGYHVHTHNVKICHFERDDLKLNEINKYKGSNISGEFDGYVRKNGSVGTRNYIGILTSVNCSATVAKNISSRFMNLDESYLGNIDGVVAFTHGTGCGLNFEGQGLKILKRTNYIIYLKIITLNQFIFLLSVLSHYYLSY